MNTHDVAKMEGIVSVMVTAADIACISLRFIVICAV